jgi:hypothetical protein
VTDTPTGVGVVVEPRGEPVTVSVNGPLGVAEVVEIVKISAAPVEVGVTVDEAKLQDTPAGSGVTQNRVTAWPVPDLRVAVIVIVLLLPAVMLTGPLFDNE